MTPEVVKYDGKTLGKPSFNLIIGTKTMNELGIILGFKSKIIAINKINLKFNLLTNCQHLIRKH
jgi:hypothetical protein